MFGKKKEKLQPIDFGVGTQVKNQKENQVLEDNTQSLIQRLKQISFSLEKKGTDKTDYAKEKLDEIIKDFKEADTASPVEVINSINQMIVKVISNLEMMKNKNSFYGVDRYLDTLRKLLSERANCTMKFKNPEYRDAYLKSLDFDVEIASKMSEITENKELRNEKSKQFKMNLLPKGEAIRAINELDENRKYMESALSKYDAKQALIRKILASFEEATVLSSADNVVFKSEELKALYKKALHMVESDNVSIDEINDMSLDLDNELSKAKSTVQSDVLPDPIHVSSNVEEDVPDSFFDEVL